MAKWTHPIGDIHKNEILKIIRNHSVFEKGVYQHEIIKQTRLSRQTVYAILKKLTAEKKIMKSQGKYIITESDEDIFFILMFEAHLDRWLNRMLIANHQEKRFSSSLENSNDTDSMQKRIFKFANVIGVFIIYLLVTGKRPTTEYNLEYEKREYLIRDIVQGRIFLENVLLGFNNYLLRKTNNKLYEEMNKNDFDKLSKAFMKVYPELYTDLEQRWKTLAQHYIHELPTNIDFKNCKHKWEKHYIFNFGEYYQCINCYMAKEG